MIVYVESSAAAKLLVDEPESAALAQFLDDLVVGGATVVSCCLLETELRRLATRIDLAQENVTELLNRIELAEVDAVVHRQAGLLPGRALRSLDAIHIVAAQRLDAAVLITYDHRQASAAADSGLLVQVPA